MLRRAWVLCVVTLLALLGLDGGGQALEASDRNRGATYENPFELPDEWPAYGVGDPFILRWNGRFYLYPSTNTHYGGSVTLPCFHLRPINLVIFQGSYSLEGMGDLILRWASRLDAFSAYPCRT